MMRETNSHGASGTSAPALVMMNAVALRDAIHAKCRAAGHHLLLVYGGPVEAPQPLDAADNAIYDLLREREKLLLQRLSVFAGGCDLAAAEAMARYVASERKLVFVYFGTVPINASSAARISPARDLAEAATASGQRAGARSPRRVNQLSPSRCMSSEANCRRVSASPRQGASDTTGISVNTAIALWVITSQSASSMPYGRSN